MSWSYQMTISTDGAWGSKFGVSPISAVKYTGFVTKITDWSSLRQFRQAINDTGIFTFAIPTQLDEYHFDGGRGFPDQRFWNGSRFNAASFLAARKQDNQVFGFFAVDIYERAGGVETFPRIIFNRPLVTEHVSTAIPDLRIKGMLEVFTVEDDRHKEWKSVLKS